MIARLVASLLFIGTLSGTHVALGQSSVAPIVTTSTFFTALNAGDNAAALALFEPDAVATLTRGETYRGPNDMVHLVQLMEHPGRRYEILRAETQDTTVTAVVAVSDHGIRWGYQTIVFETHAGKLHAFRETLFELRLSA